MVDGLPRMAMKQSMPIIHEAVSKECTIYRWMARVVSLVRLWGYWIQVQILFMQKAYINNLSYNINRSFNEWKDAETLRGFPLDGGFIQVNLFDKDSFLAVYPFYDQVYKASF